jgi:glutamate/aspartate transport system permease protein
MSYHWNWAVFFQQVPSGNATYLDWIVSGAEVTVALSLLSWLMALAFGALVGVLRTVPNRFLGAAAAGYVEVFRNIPLLAQLFIWYFVLPELIPGGAQFKQINPMAQQFIAAMICLGFFTSARVAEQVRAGIESLSRGQKAAALALGLTLAQTYRHILVPVALRIVVPPLTSEFLNIFKNSAVCSTIGLLELAAMGRQLVDYTAQAYESFIVITLLYAAINIVVMVLMRQVERRARVPGYLGPER